MRCGHVTCKRENVWEHSPTRKKYRAILRLNRGAPLRYHSVTVPPLLPGPTIPVGPPPTSLTRHVVPHTGAHVDPSTWPHATRQRHLRIAPPGFCHAASLPRRTSRRSRAPCQPPLATSACRLVNPFFAILNRKYL